MHSQNHRNAIYADWLILLFGCDSLPGKYSGTSINCHLVKAVTYRIMASIAGPERPLYVHNILIYS